jgi:hypothetical protein
MFVIIDAARSFVPVAIAKLLVANVANLFAGKKGDDLSDVAPHLCECDIGGNVAELLVVPYGKGEFGILIESDASWADIQRHLRQFLMVRRQANIRPVYFRYYDPRVLRAFLPACSEPELSTFFGSIKEFHCQSEDPEFVASFRRDDQTLAISTLHWTEFLQTKFPIRRHSVDITNSIYSVLKPSNI